MRQLENVILFDEKNERWRVRSEIIFNDVDLISPSFFCSLLQFFNLPRYSQLSHFKSHFGHTHSSLLISFSPFYFFILYFILFDSYFRCALSEPLFIPFSLTGSLTHTLSLSLHFILLVLRYFF